jgi:hypothetical protein
MRKVFRFFYTDKDWIVSRNRQPKELSLRSQLLCLPYFGRETVHVPEINERVSAGSPVEAVLGLECWNFDIVRRSGMSFAHEYYLIRP